MNKQILWLARDKERHAAYEFHTKRPLLINNVQRVAATGGYKGSVFSEVWEALFPTLTLAPGEKCKVELKPIDGGIQLRRI